MSSVTRAAILFGVVLSAIAGLSFILGAHFASEHSAWFTPTRTLLLSPGSLLALGAYLTIFWIISTSDRRRAPPPDEPLFPAFIHELGLDRLCAKQRLRIHASVCRMNEEELRLFRRKRSVKHFMNARAYGMGSQTSLTAGRPLTQRSTPEIAETTECLKKALAEAELVEINLLNELDPELGRRFHDHYLLGLQRQLEAWIAGNSGALRKADNLLVQWRQWFRPKEDELEERLERILRTQPRWTDRVCLKSLRLRDVHGDVHRLAEVATGSKAILIAALGSWSPDSRHAAACLRRLDAEYRAAGLSLLGLAFELTGNFHQDAAQVRKFVRRHDITFPILVAGLPNKAALTDDLPVLSRVWKLPTFIFLYPDGRVYDICSGTPARPDADQRQPFSEQLTSNVKEMLAENPKPRSEPSPLGVPASSTSTPPPGKIKHSRQRGTVQIT